MTFLRICDKISIFGPFPPTRSSLKFEEIFLEHQWAFPQIFSFLAIREVIFVNQAKSSSSTCISEKVFMIIPCSSLPIKLKIWGNDPQASKSNSSNENNPQMKITSDSDSSADFGLKSIFYPMGLFLRSKIGFQYQSYTFWTWTFCLIHKNDLPNS